MRILLSSYTRAYNRRYKNRGTLFRSRTNAKSVATTSYRLRCFRYIHENPVKDGLVQVATDYPHSSAAAWAGLRQGAICNYPAAERLIGVRRGRAA